MRWLLIVLLSLLGVLMGVLSLLGLAEGAMAWVLSVILWLVMAILIGQFAGRKYFLHGFLTGIIFGLINSVMIYFFFDTYVSNSAGMQEAMTKMPEGMDMRTIMIATAPINAGIAGVVLGLLSLLGGKLFGKKKEEAQPEAETP